MCGIIGAIPAVNERLLQFGLDRIAHRGPDGYGVWHEADGRIILGHRLLSIVSHNTNETQQPMHYDDKTMVYNGEIYNYLELRKELEQKGVTFQTNTDSEVILAAYQEWGHECLSRFNGMWAFAIWDKRKQELFLSRDRFGKKPLFYSIIDGQLVFASEMKAIMPFLKEHKPSEEFSWMAANYDRYEATEHTLVQGIKRFPAGHYGVYKNGELKLSRYWDTMDNLVAVPQSYEQQVEQFRELFLDATRIRLRADVKVGASLSGGLDSSSVVASIRENINRDGQGHFDKAFVATFPDTPLDEAAYARQTLDHLGLNGSFSEITGGKALQTLEDDLYQFEELYRTPPSPMMQLYSGFRQAGTFASLDGHGPDELLSGYGNFPFMAFLDMKPYDLKGINNVLETYRKLHPKGANIHESRSTSWFNYVMTHMWYGAEKRKLVLPFIDDDRKKHKEAIKRMGHFNYGLYQLFHYSIFPTLLRNYDRYSMRYGIEVRMPFTDHRLVSYCFSLPWQSKLRDGKNKAILRDAMQPLLGNEIAYRPNKIGFQSPLPQWIKGEWKEYMLDTVNSQDFKTCTLINPERVEASLKDLLATPNPSIQQGEEFWLKLSPYLWEKTFLKNPLNTWKP